jgi:hypothetical protein
MIGTLAHPAEQLPITRVKLIASWSEALTRTRAGGERAFHRRCVMDLGRRRWPRARNAAQLEFLGSAARIGAGFSLAIRSSCPPWLLRRRWRKHGARLSLEAAARGPRREGAESLGSSRRRRRTP